VRGRLLSAAGAPPPGAPGQFVVGEELPHGLLMCVAELDLLIMCHLADEIWSLSFMIAIVKK
jgi:hypothetical protein